MQPANQNISEETRQAVAIFYALGQHLRQSLEPVDEDLPPDMALLLLHLALVEVVRAAADEEGDAPATAGR